MSMQSQASPRYASLTRVDVTNCRADRIADRARVNRVAGSEVHLERRGGRTFLVTSPQDDR
ncbi:hypothetical protein [Halorubrum vacuolatum]|uniref:Uncharacterized protein n=1 Tax=Halorubrum vacuolatum TaxID=63740 RepID=A0A238URD0_HALVU|nr:hypothetical protein [Halorubrum vacuolatum]SNR24511.1 hypothetical protein SAMN06264855_101271 [Halorubrum vacuolatum]